LDEASKILKKNERMLSVRSRKIMNHIYRAFAVLGIMTSLGRLPHAVNAQVATKLIAQVSAADFYNQGLDKARRGDYRERSLV
jgi:hypothetical protein